MYMPKQLVFAPTAQCNLQCAHCRVDRSRGNGADMLTAAAAVAFIERCQAHEIDRVGFSGGEPFLEPDFLEAVCRASVDGGLYFDRLMTNGVWFVDAAELNSILQRVYDAGFDGTIAISVDAWHNPDAERLLQFVQAVRRIWGRSDCLEVVSVLNRDGSCDGSYLEGLAGGLGARIRYEADMPMAIYDSSYEDNKRAGMEDGSGLYIPVLTMPYSAAADDPAAWQAQRWFKDDWCEGPGNIFYVHPDGKVAVCCGFANENPQLIIGTVEDSWETLMANAEANRHVQDCFSKGLATKRQEMEAVGTKYPGKTGDICFFCDWLCRQELAGKE